VRFEILTGRSLERVFVSIKHGMPSLKPAQFKINKFMVGGILMAAAIVLLVLTSLKGTTQYFLTVDEIAAGKAGTAKNLRISGVVLGDTIKYDPAALTLSFTVANIPGDNKEIENAGGLAQVLHDASIDPQAARLNVVYHGERPDLLKNEAQAIMTGSLGQDGVFYAEELLLKCPSRYEDSIPSQVSP
jgi:cytochrome c-type biogenesis protein CcmE